MDWVVGGVGTRRPSEPLLKFNTSFMATRNETESFIPHKLTEEGDHIYLMKMARKRDASGHQKVLKIAQTRREEAEREERRKNKVTAVMETVKKLVLTTVEIDGLKNDELNLQLDCHRKMEERRLVFDSGKDSDSAENAVEKVPLKSHMKAK